MSDPVFPIALILKDRPCLVVGSGPELTLRTRALLDAGAQVSVVTEAGAAGLAPLTAGGALAVHERSFLDADLDGKWLAVLVDANPTLAARMSRIANEQRVLFCAVDQPEHNSYAHMAQARAGLLTIAISTAGQAPALGRRLREELERLLKISKMERFVERLAALRADTPSAERRKILGDAVASVHFTGELKLDER